MCKNPKYLIAIVVLILANTFRIACAETDTTIYTGGQSFTYQDARSILKEEPFNVQSVMFYTGANGNITQVHITKSDGTLVYAFVPGQAAGERLVEIALASNLPIRTVLVSNNNSQPVVKVISESGGSGGFTGQYWLGILVMIAAMIGVSVWLNRKQQKAMGAGGKVTDLSKTKAEKVKAEENSTTFDNIAGAEEAIIEMRDAVRYMKRPGILRKLGGKPPGGILLIGPPGNGKTLLARAVAGESNASFYAVSGSDFVEIYVGVGAGRVRDTFEMARKEEKAIIFIDEIDAVGRHRGAGVGGGNDEREQTLNQILVEMDGFKNRKNMIVIAATNRPDILDPALLRPGRFDLQVVVDLPDLADRLEILKIHARGKPLAKDASLALVAQITTGYSGADLAGSLEQAALVAARRLDPIIAELESCGATDERIEELLAFEQITLDDIKEGIDRVRMGPAKEGRSRRMSFEDKRNTAYHEVGHALVAQFLHDRGLGGDPVTKLTILPRARALGVTETQPTTDRYGQTIHHLLARIKMAMGGRIAQEVFLDTVDTGAGNDFKQATDVARRMVEELGMSSLGPINVSSDGGNDPFLGRQMAGGRSGVGPDLSDQIDREWLRIVHDCYREARIIIEANPEAVHRIAAVLIEKETLLGPQFRQLLKGPLLLSTTS